MKRLTLVLAATVGVAATAVLLAGCASAPPPAPPPEPIPYEEPYDEGYDEGGYETEYDPEAGYDDDIFWELGTYGSWIDTHAFGMVWQPRVVSGWQPFYHGHWVWTEWGWTWVSYEPFGWATDHYGNWYFDTVWGWIWVPGYEWFPNRVDWVVYDDYICWAPLPPDGYQVGDPWSTHVDYIWISVRTDHFIRGNVGRYKKRARHPREGRASNKIKRKAPAVRYVEKQTKQVIRPAGITVKTIKRGENEYTRMKLPAAQADKVERYRRRVEMKIRKPTELEKASSRHTSSKQKAIKSTGKSKEPAKKSSRDGKSKSTKKSNQTKKKGKN